MTLPTDPPMPEQEQPLNDGLGHSSGLEPGAAPHARNVPTSSAKRIGAALIRTFSAFGWSWSGRVQVDEVPGPMGLEPVAARRVPNVPSRRDKWIGAGIAAALIVGCVGFLRWLVG